MLLSAFVNSASFKSVVGGVLVWGGVVLEHLDSLLLVTLQWSRIDILPINGNSWPFPVEINNAEITASASQVPI